MTSPPLYNNIYHNESIKNASVLISGGAGFIGSNIVEYLLHHGASRVRVFDNLSNGFIRNLEPFMDMPQFEFIEGDITDPEQCRKACEGMSLLTHQAALGSVPRSIKNPVATSDANTTGYLNMLIAARDAGVKRVVYASSSSVYGDSIASPKKEENLGRPLSPYAVSKLTNELYASVFAMHYGMEIIGLRYFNVFGPNQDPNGPYAAAIPLFMNSLLFDKEAVIFGDGNQTRDFTFVENAVQANIRALFTTNQEAYNKVYNVAVGESVSVNPLYETIASISGSKRQPAYAPERKGDIKNSLADISMAKNLLGYEPHYQLREGLEITVAWFRKAFAHA
ncbi:MAG: SDR family oxidoreductase [Bacteroidetes bacterium]|nr:SDR family oxidoreductase [Bacteroidota bacterium]